MKEQTKKQVGKIGDRIFLSPAFQALTIGIPFCAFKLLFGLLALRVSASSAALRAFAWLVIVWALIDMIMNLARVYFHLTDREAPVQFDSERIPDSNTMPREPTLLRGLRGDLQYCIIAQAGMLFKKPRLFLAIDTLISFSIICFVLWSGWITMLDRLESYFWYAATTLNLISVSVVNIWIELRRGS